MILILAVTLSANPVQRILSLRPVVWVGRISYELYIWHFPIYTFLVVRIGTRARTGLLAVALTVVISAACHHLVARRFLALKRRRAMTLRGDPVSG